MKLADKITTLRKSRGWSQEELAERIEVTRQSVSKWESGLSVPDLDKIVALAALFEVSCDYLLKENAEEAFAGQDAPAEEPQTAAEPPKKRMLTSEEATGFLAARTHAAPRIALGVLLCILGAAALILLTAFAEDGRLPEMTGVFLGLGALVLFVCGGVSLFISSGLRLSAYQYMEEEPFALPDGFRTAIREEQEDGRPRFIRHMVIGVALCILSVAPLFISLFLSNERDPSYELQIACGVVGLLLLVACGVFLIVRTSMRFGGYAVLLQEGDYAEGKKVAKKKSEAVQSFFWLVVLAGYLAYSFATNDWAHSWIVWPVAAILSGVIEQIFVLTDKK
ncbi:MAG: helix-turn-helix transcriptional regulator [Clostridia bacterium]|nr:helix-turn-helix transcriptional regulator [Clostridia bacterium]